MMFSHLETIKPIAFQRLETTRPTTPHSAWGGAVGKGSYCLSLLFFVLYAYGVAALITATR